MGTQQIFLILFGVIVVALGVTVVINSLNTNSEESVKDELVSQLMIIGADAQQWYRKPVKLNGGGGAFNNSKGADSSYHIPDLLDQSEKASYLVDSVADSILYINAIPDPNYQYNWFIKSKVTSKQVTVEIINN